MNYGFFPMLLMFVALMAALRLFGGGRRRWRRGWGRIPAEDNLSPEEQATLESRLSLVERLETRVNELENRLDFTERLLAGKSADSR